MNQSDTATEKSNREFFGTRLGFVLAAVGSAVGLGNMWRFPYQAAEGGGAAFVVAYILMAFIIGVPMMLAEFAVGRRTRLSSVGALRQVGGRAWIPLGALFVITSITILTYLSVITGWAARYALDAMTAGFSSSPAERYADVTTGMPAIVFHLLSMGVTVSVVVLGVRRGIERLSLILMPTLFALLIGLAIWAATLPNAAEGYRFYLAPSLNDVLRPSVLQGAAAQAFYSLSVGMGIMITYSSYFSSKENLNREAAIIALADFSVAFVAGLVVFPVVFALGLSQDIGESTMGTLFISLPGAFVELETMGRVVGAAFFVALVVAALTSAVSLLEVVASVSMDELKWSRKKATLVAGGIAAIFGIVPAVSQNALGIMDQLAAELFTVVGVLGMSILVGWVMRTPDDELRRGASPMFARIVPIAMFLVRYIVPVLLVWITWISVVDTLSVIRGG